MKNYYEILSVSREATSEQIKKAYLRKAKKLHPDKGGNSDEFNEVKKAFDVLYNEDTRKEYDETGEVKDKPNQKEDDITFINDSFVQIVSATYQEIINVDYIKKTKDYFIYNIKQHESNIDWNIKEAAKFTKVTGKIVKKNKGENYLSGALEARIKEHTKAIDALQAKIDRLKRCIDILDDYSMSEDLLLMNHQITIFTDD